MRSYWFGDVDEQGCTRAGGEVATLVHRLRSLTAPDGKIIPPDWKLAMECGAVTDRPDYLGKLRTISLLLAREKVAATLGGKEAELIQMVILLDGMDQAANQLGERLADWYRVLHPLEGWKYRPRDSRKVLGRIREDSEGPMRETLEGILGLRETRTRLAREIGDCAAGILPNSSALIGGLVAARLMTLAGGLSPLARLPASSIQVLGARGALFSHLTRGTPPPKHGIIYQHMRVHNAPGHARGRVARVLAGRLAIAARIDFYRGMLDAEFIAQADGMIESVGRRG